MPSVLTDNNIWDESVPAIVEGDDVDPSITNLPAQALANRTAFLNNKIDALQAALEAMIASQIESVNTRVDGVVPFLSAPGDVIYRASNIIPSGWLLADGRAVSRTDYADLFTAIGTTWGAGNGTTTFNLPPLCGEFIRCLNPYGTGLDPSRTLSATPQADDLKAHTHTVTGVGTHDPRFDVTGGSGIADTTNTTSSTGGTETRPHNIALNAIIKT